MTAISDNGGACSAASAARGSRNIASSSASLKPVRTQVKRESTQIGDLGSQERQVLLGSSVHEPQSAHLLTRQFRCNVNRNLDQSNRPGGGEA